jgi:hypothetical protein
MFLSSGRGSGWTASPVMFVVLFRAWYSGRVRRNIAGHLIGHTLDFKLARASRLVSLHHHGLGYCRARAAPLICSSNVLLPSSFACCCPPPTFRLRAFRSGIIMGTSSFHSSRCTEEKGLSFAQSHAGRKQGPERQAK